MKALLLLILATAPLLAEPPKRDWMEAFEGSDPSTTVLRIKYRSIGCFHAADFEFACQFVPAGGLKVVVTENVREPTNGFTLGPVNRVKIGMLTLSGRDAVRFFNLLDYYKNFTESKTTMSTVDHLVFEKVTGEKAVVLAEIEDGTGGLNERLDLMTLEEIVNRIHPANPGRPIPDDSVPSPHSK